MFEVEDILLGDICLLKLPNSSDHRGNFVKMMHTPSFASLGLKHDFTEQFFSLSYKNVLCGMHCQLPPYEHAKLVTCIAGEILDVVLDLRHGTKGYGRHVAVTLSASQPRALYIPPGFAHGFLTRSIEALTLYSVTSVHHPLSDSGVHWESIGFEWPVKSPIVSERDQTLPALADFVSPF